MTSSLHYASSLVTPEMTLTPNVGSDRSWVWNVTADSSDDCAGPQTLAIRLANSDNAALFKEEFEKAQQNNAELKSKAPAAEEKKEEEAEEEEEEEEEETKAEEKEESA